MGLVLMGFQSIVISRVGEKFGTYDVLGAVSSCWFVLGGIDGDVVDKFTVRLKRAANLLDRLLAVVLLLDE